MIQDATRAPLIPIGKVTKTAVGSFVTYKVSRSQLPPSRVVHEKADAIEIARGQALGHDFVVIDVVAAVYQDDGSWLVELQVKSDD